MFRIFKNRIDAGRQLAEALSKYQNAKDVIILALPRGGVPVAHEIATTLNLPLDLLIVRKLGLPSNEEYAIGAIASNGTCIFNNEALSVIDPKDKMLQAIIAKETKELARRNELYRGGRDMPNLEQKTVILVDDGIATGASIKAAIFTLKKQNVKKIIVAVPVAPPDTIEEIKPLVDDVICLFAPQAFYAVGSWYEEFPQTEDKEVIELLKK